MSVLVDSVKARNDLSCVEWNVKLYSLGCSSEFWTASQKCFQFELRVVLLFVFFAAASTMHCSACKSYCAVCVDSLFCEHCEFTIM